MPVTKIDESNFALNQTEKDILDAFCDSLPNFLKASVVADVASIAAGAEATQAVTVTGAAVGDFVLASIVDATPTSGSLADAVLAPRVSAADTVTITISNVHAATALDLSAAAAFHVLVIKKDIPSPTGKLVSKT